MFTISKEIIVNFEGISPGAVGFFVLILPLFKESEPYGWCDHLQQELAKRVKAHPNTVGIYINELRNHGILKISRNGRMYSPLIIQRKL